ncbi:AMP-binding protein [Sneathiella marina]|uniref:AMP-binding protein n=1 Tax=Sneathiella marina TaxID=2950108 RepID=A0ABY4W824_9PROT|nr:AMP-binding protein [Sneathiella marina]USG63054.1 AMP-binding protein [Sneathiella marina]
MSSSVPFRELNRPSPDISVAENKDGSFLLTSNVEIGKVEENVAFYWRRSAEEFPEKAFLIKCGPQDDWPKLSYAQAKRQADEVSTWLLQRGFGPEKSVMILSGNSFAHAILTMGAIQVGVPVTPVSPSYSLLGGDFEKLSYAVELTEPGLIFAEDGDVFGKAIAAVNTENVEILTVQGAEHGGLRFTDLLGEVDETAVDAAYASVNANTLAKILFTSGSTGMPKAVPNTQGMLCAAQKTLELVSEPRDPVNTPIFILDWLPWHHTYGGNVNFFAIARVSGTIYMDDGKPAPGFFQRTLENIKRVSPTRFSSVPAAYGFLADQLEKDEELATAFFKNVTICQYGGAALSQEMFERMQVLAIKYTGMRMPFGTGWGATETTGTGTAVYWETEKVGLIGVPTPGVDLKVVPVGDKLEIRIKGANVHTGYYKRPDLTAKYFDEDGFYCIGDAVKWEDSSKKEIGLVFNGRVAEDFKLANGTWVSTGSLRLSLIDALDPIVRDIVITGHDKDDVGLLILPTEAVLRQLGESDEAISADGEAIVDGDFLAQIGQKLEKYNLDNKAPSRRAGRALVMAKPLSIDKNEITDKQYINQSAVLSNRSDLVQRLYARSLDKSVMKFN